MIIYRSISSLASSGTLITGSVGRVLVTCTFDKEQGIWLHDILTQLKKGNKMNMQQVMENYEVVGLEDFELFWDNKPVNQLHKAGLLMI